MGSGYGEVVVSCSAMTRRFVCRAEGCIYREAELRFFAGHGDAFPSGT